MDKCFFLYMYILNAQCKLSDPLSITITTTTTTSVDAPLDIA